MDTGKAQSWLMANGYGIDTLPHMVVYPLQSGRGGGDTGGDGTTPEAAAAAARWDKTKAAGARTRTRTSHTMSSMAASKCFLLVCVSVKKQRVAACVHTHTHMLRSPLSIDSVCIFRIFAKYMSTSSTCHRAFISFILFASRGIFRVKFAC
jgi:hypothetical protein